MISVIMPCYNCEQFVHEAIESFLNQTYARIELIVVDDGSTDSSGSILAKFSTQFKDRISILHQNNKGPYPARNLALKHAKGEYIAFLDADDFWRKDCLEILQLTITHKHADLAYCGWQNIGPNASGTEPYIPPQYEKHDPIAYFLEGCPWPIHAALVRSEIVQAIGGFSERQFSSMDYDFWLRILAHTRKIARAPEVLAFYRWHDKGQISSVKWRQVLDAWRVRRDFVMNNPDLIAHIPDESLHRLTNQCLSDAAYTAYWKRDLPSSQILFRQALKAGYWRTKDLIYFLPALLPAKLYQALIKHIGD